ncbi:MAG: hypothetical protein KIT31_16870 [Deltaproteobacteria bacterium]|nr:hypothetical protein [Deltaproteobacteria bacterium]
MSVRALHRAWTAVAIAIAVMCAVPFAQLRLVDVERTCCCPDPEICRCPHDDGGDATAPSTIRACHVVQRAFVGRFPTFDATRAAGATPPPRSRSLTRRSRSRAPPVPDRPRGPS